ncbi:PD-(D/E)XK nuclease family protein [Limosilactobacillus mucosae]
MTNQAKKINNFDDVVTNVSKWMQESDSVHIYVLTDSAQKSTVERELLTKLLQEQKQDGGSSLPFATMQISVETPDSLAASYLDGKDEVAVNEELKPLKRIELVKEALHDHFDDLKAFKKSARRYGFVTQLANLFEQFEDDGVTSTDLEELTHKALGDGLVNKLNDVLVVFTDFETKVKQQKLSTRAEKLAKLAELIQFENNNDFKNSHVAIVNFANPCGMEKQLFKAFENVAASTIELEATKYSKAKEISSKHNTYVVTADDTDLEAKWVANEILNLVTDSEHPVRYRDITVYVPSVTSDEAMSLANNLNIAKIKYSMATTTDLNSLPLAAFTRALLSHESNWFDINNINQLLHSELLVPSEQEDINDYRRMVSKINARMVSAKIISENQWNNPKEWDDRRFEYDEDGKKVYKDNQLVYQDGKFMLKDGTLSPEFSMIRNQILSLHNLVKSLDDKDTSEVVKELMEGLEKYKILDNEHEFYKRVNAKAHANNSSKLSSRLKEGRERFDKVMATTLSDDIKDWRTELRNAFTMAFAMPYKADEPETLDRVRVLPVMDAQLPLFKYAFVMGSNEDNYPGKLNASGIWSIDDQKILREQLDKLTADDLTHHEMIKDSFARAAISATKGTYLSFAKNDSAGGEHILSKLVKDFVKGDQKNLIQVTLNGIDSEGTTSKFLVPDFNLQSQISQLRQKQENQEAIDGQIKVANKDQFKNLYGLLGRQNEPAPLNKVMADKLYFKDGKLKVSFSSIEKYFENPYEYFLKYGLKIAEPERQQLGANNAGTYVHALLQHSMDDYYSAEDDASKLAEKGINGVKKDEDRQTQEAEMMLEATEQTKQYKYRLQSTVKRYLNQSLQWLQNTNQKPVLEEFDLANFPEKNRTIKIDDNHSIVFTGRIDRVDLVTIGDVNYIVVIDYKTGDTNNKLKNYTDKLDKGLQMQLPGYVWALEKNIDSLKEILGLEESIDLKFGAAVYAGVNDRDEGSKSGKSAYFKGIITNEYLAALGESKKLKDKGYDSNKLIEIEDIANETDVFERNVKTFGNALIDGEQPKIEPYQLGEENGLSFSRYTQIIGFDEEMGNQYNEIIVEKDNKNNPEEK